MSFTNIQSQYVLILLCSAHNRLGKGGMPLTAFYKSVALLKLWIYLRFIADFATDF